MSLLIDALRQAEQTRREAPGNPSELPGIGAEAPLRLEPINSQEPAISSKPEPSIARKPANSAAEDPRTAARQLFEVKQETPSKLPLVLALFALVCLVGGLGYLWWAMQPHSQITNRNFAAATQPPSESSRPVASLTAPSPALTESSPATTLPPLSQKKLHAETSAQAPATLTEPSKPTVLTESGQPPLNLRRTHTGDTGELTPLKRAYEAYAKGELEQAHQLYRETLRLDPKNSDALTGLGMLAIRAGYPDEARRYFREALGADPKNPVARSQLLSLIADADPGNAESMIQTLIAEQPDSAALHFALGSLFARSGRWKEAQQAFFLAYSLDGKNPDILYNLAVSLEHLGQGKLARQFYEQAATSVQSSSAGFDPAIATRRAQQLAAESASN